MHQSIDLRITLLNSVLARLGVRSIMFCIKWYYTFKTTQYHDTVDPWLSNPQLSESLIIQSERHMQ